MYSEKSWHYDAYDRTNTVIETRSTNDKGTAATINDLYENIDVFMHVLLDDEEVRLKQSGQSTDDGAGGVSESLAEVLNKDHDRIVRTFLNFSELFWKCGKWFWAPPWTIVHDFVVPKFAILMVVLSRIAPIV